ncbi:MAG: 4-hydroxy-3-methylbut-2-enyl diphosphate reductase [Betaproteobacteria bacterium]
MSGSTANIKTIKLANPRGFCAGVDRAIEIVERAIDMYGAPIYVKHEVVHNQFVVDGLRRKGAVFIEDMEDVPVGSTLIYSAHGVSQRVQNQAKERGLRIFDATCPLVSKVHAEVVRLNRNGFEIVMIGHRGHPEVEGTMGQVSSGITLVETVLDVSDLRPKNPEKLAYVTQTTLSVDDARTILEALKKRFPRIQAPKKDDICYATQNRQDAVKTLSQKCDLMIVVGSPTSSNSNRLREVAATQGVTAYLVDNEDEIQDEWLSGVSVVGVTAGASAPEVLVTAVVNRLKEYGATHVEETLGVDEQVVFQVPGALKRK